MSQSFGGLFMRGASEDSEQTGARAPGESPSCVLENDNPHLRSPSTAR